MKVTLYIGHTKWITSLAWEPAHMALPSRRFCSGSKDATIKASIPPQSPPCLTHLTPHHLCFRLSNVRVFGTGYRPPFWPFLTAWSEVQVWDSSSKRCLFSMSSHTKAISCVRWGGDGHIYSSARDCAINVWSAEVPQSPISPRVPKSFPCNTRFGRAISSAHD
jgi:ribosome assembly protein 4